MFQQKKQASTIALQVYTIALLAARTRFHKISKKNNEKGNEGADKIGHETFITKGLGFVLFF